MRTNFLKLYGISCFLFVAFGSCDESEKRTVKLVKKKVLIIYPDTFQEKPVQKKDSSYLESLFSNYGLVDINSLDTSIRVQLRYSDTANFLHRGFYDGFKKACFPCEVAIAVCNAQRFLKNQRPDLSLLILDATRPLHVQQMMWDSLKMPEKIKFNYLTPPSLISLHNYGCAVDLTLIDLQSGKELDMGSGFDEFSRLSEPAYEWKHLSSGALSEEQVANRQLLRRVMKLAGLNPISSEWWHFNYCSKAQAAGKFDLVK